MAGEEWLMIARSRTPPRNSMLSIFLSFPPHFGFKKFSHSWHLSLLSLPVIEEAVDVIQSSP